MDFEAFGSKYFGSVEELRNTIYKRFAVSGVDASNHQTAIAILYLLWSGFDRDHLHEIRNGDVAIDYIFDRFECVNRKPPELVMEFIRNHKDLNLNEPVRLSQYLLRGVFKQQLTIQNVFGTVQRMNIATGYPSGGFSMRCVYESGVFSRAFDRVAGGMQMPIYRRNLQLTDEGLHQYEIIFERHFENRRAVTGYLTRYEEWVRTFR